MSTPRPIHEVPMEDVAEVESAEALLNRIAAEERVPGHIASSSTCILEFYKDLRRLANYKVSEALVLTYRSTAIPRHEMRPWDRPSVMTHFTVTTAGGVRKFQHQFPTTFVRTMKATPGLVDHLLQDQYLIPFAIAGDMTSQIFEARLRTLVGQRRAMGHLADCDCSKCHSERAEVSGYLD